MFKPPVVSDGDSFESQRIPRPGKNPGNRAWMRCGILDT